MLRLEFDRTGGLWGVFTISSDDRNVTVISNRFIDDYMKDANEAQIKVYLYLSRCSAGGRPVSISDMADRFNHTEREVLRSLRYWEKTGLISMQYDSEGNLAGIHLITPPALSGTAAASPVQESAALRASGVQTATAQQNGTGMQDAVSARYPQQSVIIPIAPYVGKTDPAGTVPAVAGNVSRTAPLSSKTAVDEKALAAFREDRKRAELLFIVEQYVGKPLSVPELRTVCFLSESLHFSDDLIDYLVQYCVDRGKKDFRYIEKVAVNWAEKGITTPKQASAETASAGKRGGAAASGTGTDGRTSTPAAKRGSFGRFEQNSYNFGELEQQLLDN